jgi:hypothetical protein
VAAKKPKVWKTTPPGGMTQDQLMRLLRRNAPEELIRLLSEGEPTDPEVKDEWLRRLAHAALVIGAQRAAHSATSRKSASKPRPRGREGHEEEPVQTAKIIERVVSAHPGLNKPEDLLQHALAELVEACVYGKHGQPLSDKYVKELLSRELKKPRR